MRHPGSLAALAAALAFVPVGASAFDAPLPSDQFSLPPSPSGEAEPPVPSVKPPDFPEETLPTKVADVPGTWDLSRDGTNRRCVMTLLKDRGPAGQKVNFPAGCRRALPLVGKVAGWLYADEAVRLVDENIRPILMFKRRPDRRSYVATENGETFSLVPLDIAGLKPASPEAPQGAGGITPDATTTMPEPGVGTAPPPAPAPIVGAPAQAGPKPGTYVLDRFRQQGTCRLGLSETGAVKLLPGCQDDGIEVFNPIRWRFDGGRMTIVAKKGHTIDLVPNGAGGWRRDPEVGTTLVLRREEP